MEKLYTTAVGKSRRKHREQAFSSAGTGREERDRVGRD